MSDPNLVLDILSKYTLEEPCLQKILSCMKTNVPIVFQLQNAVNTALPGIVVFKE